MPSTKVSAGLLMYRNPGHGIQVFLVHPGGPFFANKHEGHWTVPKGLVEPGEDLLETAQREFTEETGFQPAPPFHPLGSVRQKSGKLTHVWAFQGDCDPALLVSNTCQVAWPPNSGKTLTIPEVDRGDWFSDHDARKLIRPEQISLLDALAAFLRTV